MAIELKGNVPKQITFSMANLGDLISSLLGAKFVCQFRAYISNFAHLVKKKLQKGSTSTIHYINVSTNGA